MKAIACYQDSAHSNSIVSATGRQWRKPIATPPILSTSHYNCKFYSSCLCTHAQRIIPLTLVPIHLFIRQTVPLYIVLASVPALSCRLECVAYNRTLMSVLALQKVYKPKNSVCWIQTRDKKFMN